MHPLLVKNRFQLGSLLLLLVLLASFMLMSPATFMAGRIYLSFMSSIPFVALLALAMTLLVIAGEIDLSFPALMAFSGYIFALVFQSSGIAWLALVAALTAGSLAGLINGLIVVYIGVPSIIATIGTQFFWYGLTTIIADGLALTIVDIRSTELHSMLVGRLFGLIPMQTIWCLVLAGAFMLLLHRRAFGDNIRFIGDDSKMAQMMGVPVSRCRLQLFALMGATAALTSVMICCEMANWWPTQGEGYLLLIFASVFIGGTSVFGGQGTLFGTLIGAIMIGMIEAGIIAAGMSGFWTRMVYGLIIVLSVSLYAVMLKRQQH